MWHQKHTHKAVPTISPPSQPAVSPVASCLAAVHQLSQRVAGMRVVFNRSGQLRSLTTAAAGGLFNQPLLGSPGRHAQLFLGVSEIHAALALDNLTLARPQYDRIPNLGYRVSFAQEVITPEKVRYRVLESFVHVFMDEGGRVYNLNSTLKHAGAQLELAGIITEEQAIATARAHLGALSYDTERAELAFAEHEGTLLPVYEVVIAANAPRQVVSLLVTAHGGQVVRQYNLLKDAGGKKKKVAAGCKGAAQPCLQHGTVAGGSQLGTKVTKSTAGRKSQHKRRRTPATAPKGRAFLRIPDPNTDIAKWLFDVSLERLPDAKVLQNENLIMYTGSQRTPVKARPDGSFNYPVNSPEFCAVLVFFALDAQIEYMKSRGLKPFPRAIPVFVEDSSVTDNAYFDPEAYEIHIGIGSGLSGGGLNRYISYDYGVEWHEDGHNFVYVQTPGNDLPGTQGAGIHEAIGDMCDLLMDWLFRYRYGQQLGATLTVKDVENDRRVIGIYAMPPDGIRIQKNNKKTPGDETGEPHDDGLIVGGAMADLMVSMVSQYGLSQGLDNFASLMLAALAIVPAQQVTFRDLLNAFLTADTKLNQDANKTRITRCFAAHGIKLASTRRRHSGNLPVIVIADAA